MECVEFDQVVLGGGSAGYAAARVLADGGQRVAVVDGSAELGGLCILRGCMPTKALLQSAEVAHAVQSSALFGIQTTFNGVDFDQVMRRKGWLIDDFAGYRREQLTSGERFQLFRSPGRFVDAHTVELDSGQRLSAQGFVIATGSKISDAPLASLATVGYLDSDDVLRLERLPESILVLGGGVIAVEFAQFFVRMGVRVTLIQRSAQLLKEVDEDAAQVLAQVLEREGVE